MKRAFFNLIFKLTIPFQFLNKTPVLFKGKNIQVVNFGFFAAFEGVIVSIIFYYYLYLKGIHLDSKLFFASMFILLLVWTGARIFHLIASYKDLFSNPRKVLFQTGFYVQGGIIGGFIGCILLKKWTDINLVVALDGLTWGSLLGQFLGRLGCYNYGCCYGKVASHRHGIIYNNTDAKVLRWRPDLKNIPLHPSQIYTALLHLAFFFIFLFLIKSGIPDGVIMVLFLFYHGLSRIMLENIREDLIVAKNRKRFFTQNTAYLTIITGIVILSIGKLITPNFLVRTPFVNELSFISFVELFSMFPLIYIMLFLTFTFLFISYGIHGKILGTFPGYAEKIDGDCHDENFNNRFGALRSRNC